LAEARCASLLSGAKEFHHGELRRRGHAAGANFSTPLFIASSLVARAAAIIAPHRVGPAPPAHDVFGDRALN
jgi:hypothetical protein